MFALLIPLVLSLAPQLAGMIFGSKGADATAKVAAVVQTVVGTVADLGAPGGAAAAVAHLQANEQASADLAVKLADLHLQMQKEQDAQAEASRQDALDELKARLGDASSARNMASDLAKAHSGLAYGSMVVSVVIVGAFGWTTYSVLTNHLSTSDGQFGSVLVGTLAAMATQVANYWLGSSLGSSTKNALLANAQDNLATSVPGHMLRSDVKR
jgi:F0F1-type ATP synthase assembly protein I